MSNSVLWQPTEAQLENSRMARLKSLFSSLVRESLPDYESFHKASIEHLEAFWRLWLESSDIVFEGPTLPTYVPPADGTMFGGHWFSELRLNFAENLMSRLAPEAMVGLDEESRRRVFSSQEVQQSVAAIQGFLKAKGLKPGDRVAAIIPNIPEAVIAMLAVTGLGGVWSSCSPDFGTQGVLDRFGQIEPRFLFVTDGALYNGKGFDLLEKARHLRASISSIEEAVCIPFLKPDAEIQDASFRDWRELIRASRAATPEFVRLPFDHPVYILYSSGTTGKPKCIVHGAGGTLLQHTKELLLHCDLRPGERILYYTTCGWMMWNWVVSSLFAGATLVIYDGSPFAPTKLSLWRIVEEERLNVFGTSAKFLAACRAFELHPKAKFKFPNLRAVLSTGSPLLPEDFDWFYDEIGSDQSLQLASISGGTDIVSCFMLGTPLKPVLRGEIQGRGLGLAVDAFDAQGRPVRDQQGELVCTKAFPCMPVAFYGDPKGERYHKAYFERFEDLWHHGDFVTITQDGGIVVHGRSDATLNPGGVRIGTAEIYRHVETHPEVADSLVVGQVWEHDERVILFVKFKHPDAMVTDQFQKEIKTRIRENASPRHIPAKILKVEDIPYTLSGKKVEMAVKSIISGLEPNNLEALANPQALDIYRKLAKTALQS